MNRTFEPGTLVISGESALRLIRAQRRRTGFLPWEPLSRVEQRRALAACVANGAHIDYPHLARLGAWHDEQGERLHLLTSNGRNRRPHGGARTTVVGSPLPAGSLLLVEPGLAVTSPALTCVTMASSLDWRELLMLMGELTGDYVMTGATGDFDVAASSGYLERSALMSADDMRAAIGQMPAIGGMQKASLAASFLVGGARSPMESIMVNAFELPCSRGGFACGPLLPNCRIDLTTEAQAIGGMPYVIADAYIPDADAVLEYNGINHGDNERRIRDEHRNMALEHMGIRVFTINRETIRNMAALERIAIEVYRRKGKRYRNRTSGFIGRHHDLMAVMRQSCGLSPF